MNTEKDTPGAQSAADRVTEWKEIKGKFQTRFGKFSDRDVENFNGNADLISEKMQQIYGYSKDRAEQEYRDFRKSLPTTHVGASAPIDATPKGPLN